MVVDGKAKAGRETAMATSIEEVPKNPVKGGDFTLSVGYQLLLKNMAERRASP